MKVLLEAGADITRVGRGGLTPLDLAKDNHHYEIENTILKYAQDTGIVLDTSKSLNEVARDAWPTTEEQMRNNFKNDFGGIDMQKKLLMDLEVMKEGDTDVDGIFEVLMTKIRDSYASDKIKDKEASC